MFIKLLPQSSWTQTALRDSQPDSEFTAPEADAELRHGPWGLEHYLLVQILDAVNGVGYLTHIAGQLEPKPQRPKPTPRPGVKDSNVRAISPEAAAYLNSRRAPKGA